MIQMKIQTIYILMGQRTIGMHVIQLNDKSTAKWKKSLFPGKTKSVPLILPRYVNNELVMSLLNVLEIPG